MVIQAGNVVIPGSKNPDYIRANFDLFDFSLSDAEITALNKNKRYYTSIHLGLHWSMIMEMAGRIFQKPSVARRWVGRMLAFVIAGYGVYAFGKRGFGGYMLLRNRFVFFDFDEPILFFYLDYIAIMGLFIFIGNHVCVGLKYIVRRRKEVEGSTQKVSK